MSPRAVEQMLLTAVQFYMRDFPQLNRLLDFKEEHSKDQRSFAVDMALDWANSIPPLSSYTRGNFPFRSLLVKAAAFHLLESLVFQLERNDNTTQDPGGVILSENQLKIILTRLDRLKLQLTQEIRNSKAAAQLLSALGGSVGVGSPFGTDIVSEEEI